MRSVNGFTVSSHGRRRLRRGINPRAVLAWLFAGVFYAVSAVAFAGNAGGGSMPWDSAMSNFIGALTGKTAFFFTVGALVVGGISLIWARDHDWSALFQRVMWVVVIGSIILFAVQGLGFLFGYGAVV